MRHGAGFLIGICTFRLLHKRLQEERSLGVVEGGYVPVGREILRN